MEVGTDRKFRGMSGMPGPIPYTAIDRYAERFAYDRDHEEYLRFTQLIRRMDTAYLEHVAQEIARKPKGRDGQ